MTAPAKPRRRRAGLTLLLTALAVASCQPLPHPFAEDKPPTALLVVRDTAGVAIAPVVGAPSPVTRKIADAMAKAFLKRDIPASAKTASLDSYQLYGRVAASPADQGRTTIKAEWWLYNAKGKIVGKRGVEIVAAASDWRSAGAGPIDRLASLSADRLTPLLVGRAPVPAPAPVALSTRRVRVAIDKIVGAPGNGAAALKAAIAVVLPGQGVDIAADGQAQLHIAAAVTVSPASPGMQHVKIVWQVSRPDGTAIGTVAQQSDLPRGRLDGNWGAIADNVAIAASGGLMQLIERGEPASGGNTQTARGPS
jgi:hypothetical protein